MRFWLKQVLAEYLKHRWFIVLFVIMFFCMGIFFGATAAKVISIDQADHLTGYFNSFLDKVATTPVSEQMYFRHSVMNNLYIMLAIYALGLTVIGIPLVLVAVFTRGFILGFTIGFLVRAKAVKGLIFAFVSVLPHNILVIPAVIAGGVISLSYSAMIVKTKFFANNSSVVGRFGIYTALMSILCLATVVAGFVEAYVTPVFIKTAAAWVR
jgi:stage II sporulation protein M